MKTIRFRLAALSLLLVAVSIRAQNPVAPRAGDFPFEAIADISYSGSSDIGEGTKPLGEISTLNSRIAALRTTPIDKQSSWLLGGSWNRFDFSVPAGAPIPDKLSSLALKLGYNRQLDKQWSLRTEIDPGLYSDFKDINWDDFNAPIGVRLVYAASRELQWFIGLNIDLRSGTPVIGGPGLRWQFAPDWMLLLIIPFPRIEYAVNQDVAIFAGASLRGGTFRVAQDFGRKHGRPELDNQDIDYRELSAGLGVRWQINPGVSLNAVAGYMFDRRFRFDDRNLLLNGDGAPQLQLALTGRF